MASLKEIKERIASVKNTRKITSAMKMVAAAKLRRVQRSIEALVPYSDELDNMVHHIASDPDVVIPLNTEREVERATIITFGANGTLCGAYNNNVFKGLSEAMAQSGLADQSDRLRIVAIGRQVELDAAREKIEVESGLQELSEKPTYAQAAELAQRVMVDFLEGRTDRVTLVYYKFISAGTQRLVCEQLLPVDIVKPEVADNAPYPEVDYILEPSVQELVDRIVPRQVALRLYTAALSASASEHAARMVAMQAATDNADKLTDELALEYNKQRQQAITAELLDIMGGQAGRR